MKSLKSLAALCAAFILIVSFSQPANAQVQTARYISITPNTKAFYEYLPQGYSATGTQKHPMILFLHGMGELGDGSPTNLTKVLRNGPPKLINQGNFPTSFNSNGQNYKFVVMSPQFVNWPSSADVDAVISYAINNYNVDPTRIYLTGLSMGGGAVWEFGGNTVNSVYPQRIAAMTPICGAAYPSVYRAQVIAANKVAVWAFHNDGDPTAPVFYTNDFVNFINAVVPPPVIPAKKTIFSSNSHDAWSKAYDPNYKENGMNMYEWMLQYSRGSVPPPTPNSAPSVNAGTDKNITLPVNSVSMNATASDPDGSIVSYNWSKVSGPTQLYFNSTTSLNPSVSNLVEGTYTFKLTVTDNDGASSSDNVSITVNAANTTPPPSGSTKKINVNIFGGSNSYANSEWNNWNSYNSNSGSLKYSDGTTSTVTANLNQQSGVSDNGSGYSATMAPSQVVRYASYSTSNRTLTISGLDNSKSYDIELFAARNGISNNTTRFSAGGSSVDVVTDNNTSNKAVLSSLTPSSGSIVISISKLNSYNYINGFTIVETGTGTPPPPPPPNVLPVANAGSDKNITLPANSVQLTGSATDADGTISSYAWTKISGPAQFSFSSTTIANPTVSGLAEGTYVFRLTATDNSGGAHYDEVSVIVNAAAANVLPVAKAGDDKNITLPVNSVQLSGSATDADGTIATYAWTKISGPAQFSFNNTSSANPTVSNLGEGTYVFRLTVTDNSGGTHADDVTVVVNGEIIVTPPPPSVTKYIKVNMYGGSNPYTNSEWNNWNSYNASSGNLKYSDGSASSVSANISQQSGVSDNGSSYTASMAPSQVVRYASYSTSNRTLTISGLDDAKTYNLEFYASRNGASNNTTRFTAGGSSVDVKTDNNSSNTAIFTGLVPSSGSITISVSKLNSYNYINGFILTEVGSGTITTSVNGSINETETRTVNSSLNIYPNPVTDKFVLQVNNNYTGQMMVHVIDMSGRIQTQFNLVKNQEGSMQTYLSIGQLKAGEYVIRVQMGDQTESKIISKM